MNEDLISNLLVDLTEAIEKAGEEIAIQGVLGGTYGYGAWFKNDVFEMRPYWWGDCECGYEEKMLEWDDTHHHAQDCYQTRLHDMCYVDYPNTFEHKDGHGRWDDKCDCVEVLCKEFGLNPNFGGYVHCTCTHDTELNEWVTKNSHDSQCGVVAPNFKHLASGAEIRWYKYIGRGMEFYGHHKPRQWREYLLDALKSVEEPKE